MFDVPALNLQALAALGLFAVSLLISRTVVNIRNGKWPGGIGFIFYLRMLLGFTFTGAIVFGFYCFAGENILFR